MSNYKTSGKRLITPLIGLVQRNMTLCDEGMAILVAFISYFILIVFI